MTCAQGLLRLLWGGGPKLECYGTEYGLQTHNIADLIGPLKLVVEEP